jgi:hypothetical protein
MDMEEVVVEQSDRRKACVREQDADQCYWVEKNNLAGPLKSSR